MTAERVFLVILDGVGVGELPDAWAFGDEGSNTLRHTAQAAGGLCVPRLQALGLGNIERLAGVPPALKPRACWGKMAEQAAGKDTILGHWEMLGVVADRPLPTYAHGFPDEVIRRLERAWGRGIIGNRPASGTVIIEELGPEHLRTGKLIVYTSADSVLQVAAHEDVVSAEELHELCRAAREVMQGEHAVGRVIARPFVGEPGRFRRTAARKDFSLAPPRPTVLRALRRAGGKVVAVGKVADILAHQDIDEEVAAAGNEAVMDEVVAAARELGGPALIIANLVDFDTLYGHRNDPMGMARALEAFDRRLEGLLAALGERDLLVVTADHGCDPTTPSTDHSREYVPVLAATGWTLRERAGRALGVRETFADVGATVCEAFGVEPPEVGTSFWAEVCGD